MTSLIVHSQEIDRTNAFERMFYPPFYISVEEGLRKYSKRHATYSYILANASTTGIELFSLLPVEDQAELAKIIPKEDDFEDYQPVVLEFTFAKMATNAKKLEALSAIWGAKSKSLKNVVTLGK